MIDLRHPQRITSLVLISAASHAIPPRPALLATIFKAFLNDFVFWSMVQVSPQGLLAALGVPLEIQKQLIPGSGTTEHFSGITRADGCPAEWAES